MIEAHGKKYILLDELKTLKQKHIQTSDEFISSPIDEVAYHSGYLEAVQDMEKIVDKGICVFCGDTMGTNYRVDISAMDGGVYWLCKRCERIYHGLQYMENNHER